MSHVQHSDDLYAHHAAPNTVPQGNLLHDISPKQYLRAAQIMLAKPTLSRKRLPVKLDLEPYRSPDFVYDKSSGEAVHKLLLDVPLNKDGVRFIHEESGVLFYGVRYVDVPYDEFVAKVDVARVGDAFRDVLGINTQVLHRDAQGRSTLQVERIAALAQPNYSAFLGKDELDVYKLEHMEYGEDEVRNWMRTVCSPNASTQADDGFLAFQRMPGGKQTRIEFVARQTFPRPRIMTATRIDRSEWFVTTVTEAAYMKFWNTTVANIMARYEGQEIGIGRPSRVAQSNRGAAVAVAAAAGAVYLRRRRAQKRR